MTINRHVIDETCTCGSTFHYEGDGPSSARVAATQWRKEHNHSAPVNGVLVIPKGTDFKIDNLDQPITEGEGE